ncbi:MAG: N-acetylmuramoyl-L-alanine amidase [Lachnospiraceae bacterium]|nr:N-acetylmuramoyl-L-alanine amidase [Lachnospiraceae bacterium]
MSSKKKKTEASKKEAKNVTETQKLQEPQRAPEPEKPKEKEEQKGTELQEILTAKSTEEKNQKKTSKASWILGSVFGALLTGAVVFLAVCFYRTSADLQAVQAFSDGLQTKLQTTEARLNELSQTVSAVRQPDSEPENVGEMNEEPVPDTTSMPKPTPAPEVYTVCIDAGHGAHDTGASIELEDGTWRQEKDDNLRLAKLVQAELEKYGIKVVMTREDDSFLELYDRTLLANSLDVDALISLHRNAYYYNGKMSDGVSGVEIWIHSSRPTADRQLANRILDAILEVGGMKDRGVRYGSMSDAEEDYAINRRSLMPSMIIEMGFVSSESDNAALDTYGEDYARAIAAEVYEWLESRME